MIEVVKSYHFYAAHRNERLDDKCRNLHGHTYYVDVAFDFPEADGQTGVTKLFAELDNLIEPIIKQFDHGLLINSADPLYKHLLAFPENLKMIVFQNQPTSVENLVVKIFNRIDSPELPVKYVSIKETTSSKVCYSRP